MGGASLPSDLSAVLIYCHRICSIVVGKGTLLDDTTDISKPFILVSYQAHIERPLQRIYLQLVETPEGNIVG